jgi:chemotaxis protein histidine kinase CheA
MNDTVQKYTGHLHDNKMLQVSDILNNLEQGLFTINLDGTINDEYSVITKKILKIDNIQSSSIQEILRMDARQNRAFYAWLDLVKRMHSQIRWYKLSKLAPVQEIELTDDHGSIDTSSFVSLSYQCIYDSDKQLSKIMILAIDITEKRLKDQQMASERQRHANDIKAILSIANATAEEISEFMVETTARLGELSSQVQLHMDNVIRQREEYPDGEVYVISDEAIDTIYRDIHTIKSNCSSYGFDLLATISLHAEDQLEKLRQPVTSRRQEELETLKGLLVKMTVALEEIHQKIKLIYGEWDEITIRIPECHVKSIIDKCTVLSNETQSTTAQDLIDECKKLAWKPLGVLLRKHQKSALQAARKLNKIVEIVIKNEKQFFNPLVITRLDEILLHIIRNAVDHGIESPEIRDELGKSAGKIYIEIDIIDELCFLVVSDDGRGIDVEALLTNAVNKKFITPEEAVWMSNDEKIALLFRSGLSTSKVVNEVSGRGMGMDIVKHRIESLGGTITTNSIFGQGTTFCVKIPVHSLAET